MLPKNSFPGWFLFVTPALPFNSFAFFASQKRLKLEHNVIIWYFSHIFVTLFRANLGAFENHEQLQEFCS